MLDRVGLISAYHFDGRGNARPVDWDDLPALTDQDGFVWIHLQQNAGDYVPRISMRSEWLPICALFSMRRIGRKRTVASNRPSRNTRRPPPSWLPGIGLPFLQLLPSRLFVRLASAICSRIGIVSY